MKKYKQTKTVYAEQWFLPEDHRHVPIEGMVKLPRHRMTSMPYEQQEFILEDTWFYWGNQLNNDYHPVYQPIEPGWWVVREGFSVYVDEWFSHKNWELDT